jgi:hypothetical protein
MAKPFWPDVTKKPVVINPLEEANKKRALTFQEELQAKHKQMLPKVHYNSGIDKYRPDKSKSLQEELVEEVNKIAAQIPNAKVIQPPGVKSFQRALQKVEGADYGGNWEKMKDLNRCTLVVSTASDIINAWRRVRDHFKLVRHSTRLQLLSEKLHDPNDRVKNPCGYSGATIFVRTAGGDAKEAKKGEVQINYPPMMYAKALKEFSDTFGQSEVTKMRTKYMPVPGGLGHGMYEKWQAQEQSDIGKANAAACKLYYDYFRSDPTDLRLGQEALEAVRKLKAPGVQLPPPLVIAPAKVPSWMAESQRVWTRR